MSEIPITIIVNERSGNGSGSSDLNKALSEIKSRDKINVISFNCFTQDVETQRRILSQEQNILVVGGDGTFFSVVNLASKCYSTQAVIGHIANGSVNVAANNTTGRKENKPSSQHIKTIIEKVQQGGHFYPVHASFAQAKTTNDAHNIFWHITAGNGVTDKTLRGMEFHRHRTPHFNLRKLLTLYDIALAKKPQPSPKVTVNYANKSIDCREATLLLPEFPQWGQWPLPSQNPTLLIETENFGQSFLHELAVILDVTALQWQLQHNNPPRSITNTLQYVSLSTSKCFFSSPNEYKKIIIDSETKPDNWCTLHVSPQTKSPTVRILKMIQ